MKDKLASPLAGIIPPLITPLLSDATLDEPSLARLLEHVIAGGVHGVFILGTTGEAPSLAAAVKRRLIESTCAIVAGRIPVLVGISETCAAESVDLAEHASRCGADAVVLAPPYYYPLSQTQLLEYLDYLTPRLTLPLFLYNQPFAGSPVFALPTLRAALQHSGIAGLKDSSGDLVYFQTLLQEFGGRDGFALLTGSEPLLAASLLLGAHGGVCGTAQLIPHLYVSLYNAATGGDLVATRELHRQVLQAAGALTGASPEPCGILPALKYALSRRGLCRDILAQPLRPLTAGQQTALQRKLDEVDVFHEVET